MLDSPAHHRTGVRKVDDVDLERAVERDRDQTEILWGVNGQIYVRLSLTQVAGSQRAEEHDLAEVGVRLDEALREPVGLGEPGGPPLSAHVVEVSRSLPLSRFESFGYAAKEALPFLVHSRKNIVGRDRACRE